MNAKLSIQEGDLALIREDGVASVYPTIFLRDNCRCAKCRHPSGQRLTEIGDLVQKLQISSLNDTGGLVRLVFSDGHESVFDISWLRDHDLSPIARLSRREHRILWGAEITDVPPQGDWREVSNDAGAELAWLETYFAHGFALLRDVPTEPGMVAKVGDRLGFVRVTNYGRLFDVKSVPDPNNLAYTALGLGVHSDNPYREPTPGVQLLHCLIADAPGGETVLVDGFAAVQDLQKENPLAFRILSTVPASFRFQDRDVDLRATRPMISVDFDGEIVAVHFNNRSISTLDVPGQWVKPWYDAYRAFAAILKRPGRIATLRLGPGDLIVMQNERALHGRTAYDPSLGRRHLQGCYVDKDAMESRRRVLRRDLGCASGEAAA